MLQLHATPLDSNTVRWGALELDHRLLSFGDVSGLWCSNAEFRRAWVQALRGMTFASLRASRAIHGHSKRRACGGAVASGG